MLSIKIHVCLSCSWRENFIVKYNMISTTSIRHPCIWPRSSEGTSLRNGWTLECEGGAEGSRIVKESSTLRTSERVSDTHSFDPTSRNSTSTTTYLSTYFRIFFLRLSFAFQVFSFLFVQLSCYLISEFYPNKKFFAFSQTLFFGLFTSIDGRVRQTNTYSKRNYKSIYQLT